MAQDIKTQFLLNQEITFLNHGSFGACPSPVFNAYQQFQKELESEPIQFFTKTGPAYQAASKKEFAKQFSCDTADFFFTANPTTAFNTIAKSLNLKDGDEILSTNLEYGAVDKTWMYYCKKTGAKYIQQEIPLPITSKSHFLEEFWKGYTKKTKIISICHITSSTGLIIPIKEICEKAKSLGLTIIIDGAHAPGQIPLNLKELDVDYYFGALHKWFLAPKGSSFLYAAKKVQEQIEPLIVSWGYESETPGQSQFLDWHEFNGTRDFSAYLCLPEIAKFREELNWEELIVSSRELIIKWYPKFCKLLNTEAICPINNDFLAQMCSIPIQTNLPSELKEILYLQYKIEVPITNIKDQYFIRISIQPYNSEDDLKYLYESIQSILQEGKYLN